MSLKLLLLLLLLLLSAAVLVLAALPHDAAEAHQYADGVLAPRFHAAFNDWAWQHPRDREGRAGEHCRKLDAGDLKRWKEVRQTFRELDQAMKRAGY